jgi:hypothetical protein
MHDLSVHLHTTVLKKLRVEVNMQLWHIIPEAMAEAQQIDQSNLLVPSEPRKVEMFMRFLLLANGVFQDSINVDRDLLVLQPANIVMDIIRMCFQSMHVHVTDKNIVDVPFDRLAKCVVPET